MKTIISISTNVKASLSQAWRSWTSSQHIVNWNFASDTWHCPKAELDLQVGGKFNYHMAAKDGSMAFDFEGTFDDVKEMESLAYTLADGRSVLVKFEQKEDHVLVTEEFEAEEMNSSEMQKNGWQAILDNFKKYTEELNTMDRLTFQIDISAPVEKVYDTMLGQETYPKWTAAFHPSSFYRGKWEEGEKILFLGLDENGNEGGMVSRVRKLIPSEIVSIEHVGMYDKGEELLEDPEVSAWAGAIEEYRFEEKAGLTTVKVLSDCNKEYKGYFLEAWPKALEILKSICEQ
ncbi:SRPBCC family protein [Belliella marina]|uniref:SRPBCC family protein n=1 Tax=Belliella marina TaxID=1644146 RepID=A0ABW4VIR7_9BACT